MIYNPDTKVMQALHALLSNQNFQTLVQFLEECQQRTDKDMRRCKEEYRARWFQGAAQELEDLLKLIEKSKRL